MALVLATALMLSPMLAWPALAASTTIEGSITCPAGPPCSRVVDGRTFVQLYTTSLTGVTILIEVDVADVLDDLPPTVEGEPITLEIATPADANGWYHAEEVVDRGAGTRNQGTQRDEQPKPPRKEDDSPSSVSAETGPIVPTVQWGLVGQRVAEGVVAQVVAQVSAPTTVPVAVPFTIGGTATAGVDFTTSPAAPSNLVISPGASTAQVTVTVLADAIPELDESIVLTLGAPTNATAGANLVHAITIPAADPSAPSVVSTAPANGATAVGIQSNIVVTFSEPVNVTLASFAIGCPAAQAFTLSGSGTTTVTLDPTANLPATSTCTVTVIASQVSDIDPVDPPDSIQGANPTFTFSTSLDAAPTVLSTAPANGATGVGSQANLTVTFNEAVTVMGVWFQVACGVSGTRDPTNSAVGGGPTTFTINPNLDFTPGETCTLTVSATQVRDQDALDPPDTMAATVASTFTVDAAPTVTTTSPANGAPGVSTSTNITVSFSEPVNVTLASFTISCAPGGPQAFSIIGNGTAAIVLDPTADLPAGSTCTVTVLANQVVDVDTGDPPDTMPGANSNFSFTIDAAPSVTSSAPANGAVGVSRTDNIIVDFGEPVNATTASFTLSCGGPNLTYSLSASPATSFTLDPSALLPKGALCTLTVAASQVSDADTADPPNTMQADVVRTFTTAGTRLYVANSNSNTVSVINTPSNTVVGSSIPVGVFPFAVAALPDGTRVYVVNQIGNTVSVIDTATHTVIDMNPATPGIDDIPVGALPIAVAALPDGSRIYVNNYDDNTVSVIDTATNTVVATIPVGVGPSGVAALPDGSRVYVVNQIGNTVSVIDTATNTVIDMNPVTPGIDDIPVGALPIAVAALPDGTRVYVTNTGDNNVSVIDTATNTVVGSAIPVGSFSLAAAALPDGSRVYVANLSSGNVSVIDTATNTVVATISVSPAPSGLAALPDGSRVYVANQFSNTVSVIDTATNTVIDTNPSSPGVNNIPVGDSPTGMAIVP